MSDQLRAFLDKASRSLAAAEKLREEGFHDFAASRANYSMFYAAEGLLASLGQAYSSHGAVQAAFGREFAKSARLDAKFHRWLIDAQDFRLQGDYESGSVITPEQSDQICRWAKEFLRAAEEYARRRSSP